MIQFTVPGPPVSKARPRVVTLTSKSGKPFSHAYTPKKTANYENWIRLCFEGAKPKDFKPLEGPVKLYLNIYEAIPASFSKKKRQDAVDLKIFPLKKPDWDNFGKIFSDALNGIAYTDDKNIVQASVTKNYGLEPRVWVCLGSYFDLP